MRRITSRRIALMVLAFLVMSGPAEAFTPVPIPTPRGAAVAATHIVPDQARAIIRTE